MARLNYQSFAMIALTQTEAECRAALSAPSVAGPDKIAQKAAVQLQTMNANPEIVSLCNRLAREFAPEESGTGRGRVALSVGMTRSYKAQALEGSDAFIRLPVGVLGAFKGDEVTVEVENGRLIVTRA
jgi:hypothetical protein